MLQVLPTRTQLDQMFAPPRDEAPAAEPTQDTPDTTDPDADEDAAEPGPDDPDTGTGAMPALPDDYGHGHANSPEDTAG